MIELRPLQITGVEAVRQAYRDGHRSIIAVAPCGFGKTVVAAHVMHEARARDTRCAFVVDRTSLVDQTSAMLDNYGIPHGIIQADHWRRHGHEPIQICSAQTLEKRGFFPDLKFLIVDEAHCVRKETAKLIQSKTNMRVLGLTATPFAKGMAALYSHVVNMSTVDALIAEGWLVPLRIYFAVAPDMTGAKIVAGEWSDRDVTERGSKILGDIVEEWRLRTEINFGGPVKTIAFSASVEHGAQMCRRFGEAGFRFEQISYRDANDGRRRELIEEFRKPNSEIMGLVSCEALAKGFDVPDVLCGIGARPYRKSLSSHIQQVGRVQRPATGKSFALWLDHAGNMARFYGEMRRIFALGVSSLADADLDSKPRKEPDEKTMEQIKCSQCGFHLPPASTSCPSCGHERPRRSVVEELPGRMVEISDGPAPKQKKNAFLDRKMDVWEQLVSIARERYEDQERGRRWAQANYRNIYGEFARRAFEKSPGAPPTDQLRNHVKYLAIKRARGNARSESSPIGAAQ